MIDKSKMLDTGGRPITQSLFLEVGYSDLAIYTLKDGDHQHNGKNYPSIKRLYLEMADPTEYKFANTYLLGWRHWIRITENKVLSPHVQEWREELEYKIRSEATRHMIESAKGGNFQAIKWLTDRGWISRGAGRPSKADIEHHKAVENRIANEYGADVVRMFKNP